MRYTSAHCPILNSGTPSNDTSDGSPPYSRPRQLPGAACSECRRRKLRCDREKPRCRACQAADINCIVPTTRPSRGPKRGYLKTLQERISALEGLLEEHQRMGSSSPAVPDVVNLPFDMSPSGSATGLGEREKIVETEAIGNPSLSCFPLSLDVLGEGDLLPGSPLTVPYQEIDSILLGDIQENWFPFPSVFARDEVNRTGTTKQTVSPSSNLNTGASLQLCLSNTSTSSEAPPNLALTHLVQSDLNQLYIDRIHKFVPIVHHDSGSETQMTLRHAMWTLAASASAYHLALRDALYHRTRQLLESPDHSSSDINIVNTETVQAWLLLAIHELACVSFRCAWISAGHAFRLIQLDPTWTAEVCSAADDTTPPDLADHPQWVEVEKRRRTFWFAYCLDRLLSLRNGSSPMLSERLLMRLPCPDHEFQYGQSVVMGTLSDVGISTSTATSVRAPMSPFGECIWVATVAGRVLSYCLEATTEGQGMDLHNCWDSLSSIDSLVTQGMRVFTIYHPPTAQERDPMLLFLAMVWRATIIYLWHTAEKLPTPAINKNHAMKARLSQQAESAALEILRLIGKLSGWSSWKIHPLMSIPLSLCVELLTPRPSLVDALTQMVKELTQASQGTRVF
ncbi:hypothetical protein F4802DRAFT_563107 [Xylaria palmicola]|nr:hypothetical protein F4802DRAFT_563107 [Xylaria palmicola]